MMRDPGSPMNNLIRERKADRDARTEERQARFFRKPEEPEADDLRKLREQADADREAAASARRRAEAASRRVA